MLALVRLLRASLAVSAAANALVVAGLLLLGTVPAVAAEPAAQIRLYTLDGGAIEFKDMASFSDTGDYDGQSGKVVVPCFLIRHPKGTLMWDTGLAPAFAKEDPWKKYGVHATVGPSIEQQLKQIGLTPAEITYVAFSHLHIDHIGNANLFAGSTWILNRKELAWATGPDSPAGDLSTFSAYKNARQKLIDRDFDVFGDGTVTMLSTPGHTPGHEVLLLRLKSGNVVLSGDLWHLRSDVAGRRIYAGNLDRAATLASFDRVQRILTNLNARLIVQHDPQDYQALPKIPAYLE
ncbi:MAG TPA: N-acyl homoserine lactonase family protein [Steroidobacteraceae bacterium]|jgi:glyoxylase-like metal-dependent hydrolase (beta-lactamase superfamily II)